MRFGQGHVLRRRFRFGGALLQVYPVRVVDHADDGLLLWLPTGAPMWRADVPAGKHPRDVPRDMWPPSGFAMQPDYWRRKGALIYQPEETDTHSIWWLFSGSGRFRSWYVNLERRSMSGDDIKVGDLELDLIVAADRSWTWKDEESFAAKVGHPGYWTAEEAQKIRACGEQVAREAEAGKFPFDGTWCDFRPDPEWPELTRPFL
ncbi:DUF402 domain-containing protein [Micromonospora sp. NPDC049679]|uniref:DUF402 domain-containing protein n=1 Tax=Micromonospora sp. NPDC049679 TaxID=3155920 RepID=UPI0034078282